MSRNLCDDSIVFVATSDSTARRLGAVEIQGDRHVTARCILLQLTLPVRLNMSKAINGQTLSTTQYARPRYTGERLLRERPKIYRQVRLPR